jgi:hypothetical protein
MKVEHAYHYDRVIIIMIDCADLTLGCFKLFSG